MLEEELEQALAFPWEKWGVFLHPSQRALVERSFSGPARVAGRASDRANNNLPLYLPSTGLKICVTYVKGRSVLT